MPLGPRERLIRQARELVERMRREQSRYIANWIDAQVIQQLADALIEADLTIDRDLCAPARDE